MRHEKLKLFLNTFLLLLCIAVPASSETVDEDSGLIIDKGFETVKTICTACHSARLIIQNRMERQGWIETIQWMQETQGLQVLDPETEEKKLEYPSSHYVPLKTFRRPPLNVQWE